MTPAILLAVVALTASLPPIVDGWIAKRVTDAKMLGLYTLLVGVAIGSVGGVLSLVAGGSSWSDAATVQTAGALSGLAAGLANWYHANNPAPAPANDNGVADSKSEAA